MAAADFEQRDVALAQGIELVPDEVRNDHSLSWAFHKNDGVSKEQISVLGAQIPGYEARGLVVYTEHLRQIDHS